MTDGIQARLAKLEEWARKCDQYGRFVTYDLEAQLDRPSFFPEGVTVHGPTPDPLSQALPGDNIKEAGK